MVICDIPKLLRVCPICGKELEYVPHPRCDKCHETFEYDPKYKVFRNPNIIDISYNDPESSLLSNLYPHPINIPGYIHYASMEAFLRGLCWGGTEETIKNEIALLFGKNAINVKYILPDWRKTQKLYWLTNVIERESNEYQDLIHYAYDCLYESSRLFRMALFKSKGKIFIHSIGKNNPKETLLTSAEFIHYLDIERERL